MLNSLVNLVFACRHSHTTRPITPVNRAGDTFVTCLGCGKRLHYDLATMRIGKPFAAPDRSSFADPSHTSMK